MKSIGYKDINGFYEDIGTGEVILLVHGYCGDHRVWEPVIDAVSSGFRVILPDLPGFGKSELTGDELTVGWMADYLLAIADQEGIDHFTLLGHSMGGYTALAFADRYAERLNGLGLIHSHCFADSEEKLSKRKRALKFLRENDSGGFVKELYKMLFTEAYIDAFPEVVELQVERALEYPKAALIAGYEAMLKRPDRSEVLGGLQCPVLLFSGKEDLSVDYDLSLKQATLPVIGDIHLLDDVAHMGMFEATNDLIAAVNEFMRLVALNNVAVPH